MCGIAALAGPGINRRHMSAMLDALRHRGPDASGMAVLDQGRLILGHNRLSIIDLSSRANQPMSDPSGRFFLILNGEIYNYRELRGELSSGWDFRTASDTEVLLAAWSKKGPGCLDELTGMFSFVVWDALNNELFAARDRFGVKPLYYTSDGVRLVLASEIKALHALGLCLEPDEVTWATYLSLGYYDCSPSTFWMNCMSVRPGHWLSWRGGTLRTGCWFDLASRLARPTGGISDSEVAGRYMELLFDSVGLRFRSDVPVGINLSGGLDSSILLGIVNRLEGRDSNISCYTFSTGDPTYDETPWVAKMLEHTGHEHVECRLSPQEVPCMFDSVTEAEDEPFGGLPTLAYARVFERARQDGTLVLLDGQGMDEQWAGYDYYPDPGAGDRGVFTAATGVQGTRTSHVLPGSLAPEFRRRAAPPPFDPTGDDLLDSQLRDITVSKLPRALRFNDRISMRCSTELREPFLDHRLFIESLPLPPSMKIRGGLRKYLLRQIASELVPEGVALAPKRPLQTPQREWLAGPLSDWAWAAIERCTTCSSSSWFEPSLMREAWERFKRDCTGSSFHIWQWISLSALADLARRRTADANSLDCWGTR